MINTGVYKYGIKPRVKKLMGPSQTFWSAAGIFLLIVFCGCSNTRYLSENEELCIAVKLNVNSETKLNKKAVKKEMDKIASQRLNKKTLGLRAKLWVYNHVKKQPNTKLGRWLKNKVGEPPVLMSSIDPDKTSDIMISRLNSLGFFNSRVSYRVVSKRKKAKLLYTVTITTPYMFNTITFPQEKDTLNNAIRATQNETLVKPGKRYNLDVLKDERARIDQELKNNGFYFFNQDFLLFKIDTAFGNKTVNATITVKKDIPERAKYQYTLEDVYVISSFSADDSASGRYDTVSVDGLLYIDKDSAIKPKAIVRSIFLKKDGLYSRKLHNQTISRLMGMGVFKFVTIKYIDTIVNNKGRLRAFIYMTRMPEKSFQAQLEVVTKSNNFTGPALTLSYKNRNLLRGVEQFVFNTNGGFELQLNGFQKRLSYELGANAQLYIPKFVTPIAIRNGSSMFVPKTRLDIGFRLLNRVLFFNMRSFHLSYGYIWKETAQKEHQLDPISINFARLYSTTPAFEQLLNENSFLRKSFEQQFTIGSTYSFTYNTLIGEEKKNQYYFTATIDLSGNTLSLLQSLNNAGKPSPESPYTLFDHAYSQYSKVSTDARYYYSISKKNKVATRLIAGIGVPYGNSNSIPYIKQFFSGGANSIRAFLPRTVGPGTYQLPDSLFKKTFLDQAGDIKLEGNVEYRFTIVSFLKGAVFADAGNVWLIKPNPELPGGEFTRQFYKQLAVGTGLGIRVDISFIVIRFDVGIPLRNPELPENERWVMDNIDFGSSDWRKQNVVLNIAIGYPF
jgi:outer membrane protein assembly factor BamA